MMNKVFPPPIDHLFLYFTLLDLYYLGKFKYKNIVFFMIHKYNTVLIIFIYMVVYYVYNKL